MAIDYDNVGPGQFAAAAQEYFLRQPNGSLAKDRATALSLQGFLLAILLQLGEAEGTIEAIPKSMETVITRGRLLLEAKAAQGKILHMLDICNAYIERGMGESSSGPLYFCVTAPLLLGWNGNKDCSATDPKQKVSHVAFAGTPVRIMREAEVLGDFEASQSVGLMAKYLIDSAANLPETLGDTYHFVSHKVDEALEGAGDYITDIAKDVAGRQFSATAIGLGILGIAGLIYLKK